MVFHRQVLMKQKVKCIPGLREKTLLIRTIFPGRFNEIRGTSPHKIPGKNVVRGENTVDSRWHHK